MTLEDIAAQTRIPPRHLESLEASDWDKLPAPTYTIGFAKSYARAVGLDRAEIGDQLRAEMGGQRAATHQPAEVFEPADPARTMPKWLVFGAIAAVIAVVLLMSWLNERSLEEPGPDNAAVVEAAPAPQASVPAPAPTPATAQGPVVLTATGPAWIRITDQGRQLFEGVLQPGQSYTVPATATAPMLRAGAPEALRINVGSGGRAAGRSGRASDVERQLAAGRPDARPCGCAGRCAWCAGEPGGLAGFIGAKAAAGHSRVTPKRGIHS